MPAALVMCAPPVAIRVAVDLDAGGDVCVGAAVHPSQLVLDVREGLEDLPLGELVAETGDAFAAAAVAARATRVERWRPRRAGPEIRLGRRGEGADVHERPQRQGAERRECPERDLLACLGRGDDGNVGLRRWRTDGCRGRGRRGCRSLHAGVADVAASAAGAAAAAVLGSGSAALGLRSCGLAALQQVLGNFGHGCPR